jgi:hypothetical protein
MIEAIEDVGLLSRGAEPEEMAVVIDGPEITSPWRGRGGD